MKHTSLSILLSTILLLSTETVFSWGFYAHARINHLAVYLLPPEMMVLYKPNIAFLEEHATDPDKRRYAVVAEGPRHYIDIDHYGEYPYAALPRKWKEAVELYTEDTLTAYGIVPWHIQKMLVRLTEAFVQKNYTSIMKNSAEIGHYIADAHVPLHASSNHNGQLTNQKGIHGFWESRVPELLAETEFDFLIGKASYIPNPAAFIWNSVLESAHASDSVLRIERALTNEFSEDNKYAYENRNGITTLQYSADFTRAYHVRLQGMVERRMRSSIYAVASLWYTAWVNAGQPDLTHFEKEKCDEDTIKEFNALNRVWQLAKRMIGREE